MEYPFLQRNADGQIWRAGKTVWGLCAAWNHATNPALPMTDEEHQVARRYARAIKSRMARLGVRYLELSNGTLWPVR